MTGGLQSDNSTLFYKPTVLSNMSVNMDAYKNEIFGPVACIYSFSDESQAIKMSNNTQAGLAAYIYTKDQKRLKLFINSLEAGVVGANTANIFSNDLPFGGIKQSGLGREHGWHCLDEYLETKSICMRI